MNEEFLNRVLHGNCLELMNELEPKSIDMILCDLPYGVTNKSKNKWDTVIPFDKLWEQYCRIIKDNGAVVLFSQGLFTAKLQLSNEKWWRYDLEWEKDRPSGFLNAKRMPLRSHEDIQVFYKKLPTYNPQFWEGEPLHGMGNKFREKGHLGNSNYGDFDSHTNPSAEREGDTRKYPRSVLKFKRPHPPIFATQKPVDLCEWLIKTYTNEGETVLDNCLGSGTTAVASINTNRNWIGIEKEWGHCLIANERIKHAKEQLIESQ